MSETGVEAPGNVAPLARRPVGVVAGGTFVLLMLVAARYGYHRDELYFLVAGRHLAWGYPDQPPLLPFLTRVMTEIAPRSLTVLRIPAALAAAGTVVAAALTAREMGGGRRAQTLTAALTAICPFVVAIGHTFYTASPDVLASTVLVWLAVRWVRTRDDRMLLAAGGVAGVALNVKYLAGFLVAAIIVGMLVSGPREVLRRPLLWAGVAVAAALAAPSLVWQARHGWPQIGMAGKIEAAGAMAGRPGFVPFQVLLTGVLPSWLWIYGLWRLARPGPLRRFRFLAWAYLLLAVFFLATGGKPYYLAGLWPALWAAGAVHVERLGAPRGWGWSLTAPAVAAVGLVTVALTLPVYPVRWLHRTPQPVINVDSAEMVGWPRFVEQIAAVHRALPDRDRATLLTGNYGEAGAIDRYGGRFGLPRAYSGHNGFWYFGRPSETGGPTIVVGPESAGALLPYWTSVTRAGRVDDGVDLSNQEQGKPIWVCRGQRMGWADLWPRLKHLG
ncbi:glycosyltransferase family 39 protein [Actinomadura gamaensis]|uniref:Glycosyltransferase family 39 protein n=1 Tax=Actinomadura gamaensis TaxID=1763541 RepID=A0ABV9U225_9ACTN